MALLKDKPELVRRECKCGCGKFFKVLATSKSEYASKTHDPAYEFNPYDSKLLANGATYPTFSYDDLGE